MREGLREVAHRLLRGPLDLLAEEPDVIGVGAEPFEAALGTLVLSSGGLVQGVVGKDEAFALSLACFVLSFLAIRASMAWQKRARAVG